MSGIRRPGRLEGVLAAGGKRARLAEHSRQVILAGQTPEGAYLAAPTFPTYRYSWFRDGAFIADAMDLIGETESAAAFHRWTLRVLEPQLDEHGDVRGGGIADDGMAGGPAPGGALPNGAGRGGAGLGGAGSGGAMPGGAGPDAVVPGNDALAGNVPQDLRHADRVLHTRYLPDGSFGTEDWPNFQLDGFGTWLWAYRQHVRRHSQGGASPSSSATIAVVDDAARAVVRRLALYLARRWAQPNFDCWEEHPDEVHPSTLGAIDAGLRAAGDLLEDRWFIGVADAVRAYLLTHGVTAGSFVKHVGSSVVDANLLWLARPYQVVSAGDERFSATLERIAATLQDPGGGVHRYARDTFYGGGSWPLLTADLAQVRLARGERAEAERLLDWIEAQATPDGDIPEQVATHANDPAYLPEWVDRWGTSACPLLWSHAAYLRLLVAFEANGASDGPDAGSDAGPRDAPGGSANGTTNESESASGRARSAADGRAHARANDTSNDTSNGASNDTSNNRGSRP